VIVELVWQNVSTHLLASFSTETNHYLYAFSTMIDFRLSTKTATCFDIFFLKIINALSLRKFENRRWEVISLNQPGGVSAKNGCKNTCPHLPAETYSSIEIGAILERRKALITQPPQLCVDSSTLAYKNANLFENASPPPRHF